MKSRKTRDTDYLHVSTRVRALETKMLGRERVERMLEARTDAEALKPLSECGYETASVTDIPGLEEAVHIQRKELYSTMETLLPHRGFLDVFRIRYDYHNIKTILKSAYSPGDADLVMEYGRYPAEFLRENIEKEHFSELSAQATEAVLNAREMLARTRDSQLSDILLDRAMFGEMSASAKETGSKFLSGYIAVLIDAANLRTVVRLWRMDGAMEYLKQAVIAGGSINAADIVAAALTDREAFVYLYRDTSLAEAAAYGLQAAADLSVGLTQFEKLCDNGVNAYLKAARYVPFGDAPAVAYIAAKENEFTMARTIMSGRFAGLETDTIRERLRDTYV